MTGSVGEWIDDWYDETRGLRRIARGSWVYTRPEEFLVMGQGEEPAFAEDFTGFRLVLVRAP